ncbi:hypothetical protein NGRA_3088 [Nosema granulosis]|uniref:Integrase catalytic domain-containing protein n=1 Tax=Nosema granulosis TaxID=83296 RepID=A0A9P6KXI3_9MICR|nr:hypothetical protein NGRA_3088 [Nosema granulosis]
MKRVKKVLARCKRCNEYNPMGIDGFRYIVAFEPGETVAMDVIGHWERNYIATAIDYFSRFSMAKVYKRKTSENILEFLELVNRKLNIKMLITDGAKENTGDLIRV